MDTKNVLARYKSLVGEATVESRIVEAVTIDKEHNHINRFVVEDGPTYNRCHTVEEFKAKIESLSVWLAYKLKQEHTTLPHGRDNSLLQELHSLKERFYIKDGEILHRSFAQLTRNHTKYEADMVEELVKGNKVTENYTEYIRMAHDNLSQLLSVVDVEEKFNRLFIGDAATVYRNKNFTVKILQEQRLVDTNGKSIIPNRSKVNLWAVMKVLQEAHIVKDTISDEEYMAIVWEYIGGEGAAPTRISASSVSNLDKTKKQLKSIYFKNT